MFKKHPLTCVLVLPIALQVTIGCVGVYNGAFDDRDLGLNGYVDGSVFTATCDLREIPKEVPYLAYVMHFISMYHPECQAAPNLGLPFSMFLESLPIYSSG